MGLAGGILWGAMMLLMTLISLANGYGTGLLNIMMQIYPGYTITAMGSIIGLIYGFIDGFVCLYILAWVYNWLEKR